MEGVSVDAESQFEEVVPDREVPRRFVASSCVPTPRCRAEARGDPPHPTR